MTTQEYPLELLAETENFGVFRNQDQDDVYYHVELGSATLHFTAEEWEEFAILIRDASAG